MGFEIGKTVAGYEILEVLGGSKTGVAYKVRNVFAQRIEVLKILPKNAHPEIAWHSDIPERGPLARCDRRQLGQALTNLLQNAIDAIAMRPGDGRIEVTVRDLGEEIMIRVADDGIGLPDSDRARLTEPYITHKPKGTGLGLAIVKKIMEDHGGRIVLEDRAPEQDWEGPGAVATLYLPSQANDGA